MVRGYGKGKFKSDRQRKAVMSKVGNPKKKKKIKEEDFKEKNYVVTFYFAPLDVTVEASSDYKAEELAEERLDWGNIEVDRTEVEIEEE